MRVRRWFAGAVSLVVASGCVAISGVGDLEIQNEDVDGARMVPEGGGSGTTSSSSTSGTLPVDGSTSSDADVADVFSFDATVFEPRDTGGPDTGPAGEGVVQCSGSLQCTGGKSCCFSPYVPAPSCATTCGFGGGGLACDDHSDCPGKRCCITSSTASFSATSECNSECEGRAMEACKDDSDCRAGENCRRVQFAPGPFRACQ